MNSAEGGDTSTRQDPASRVHSFSRAGQLRPSTQCSSQALRKEGSVASTWSKTTNRSGGRKRKWRRNSRSLAGL